MPAFKDEVALWEYIAPRMRGRWERLETIYPPGLPDSFGLFRNQTWWLEHKVGKPSLAALRPKQIDFAHECVKRSVPWWSCFGYRGSVLFFEGLQVERSVQPPFWIPASS